MSDARKILYSQPFIGRITVNLPRSKSISNRLLVMRALSKGAVQIENASTADDTRLLEAALQSRTAELWMGHAGTALRFGLAWAAITPGERLITGSDRLSERPIHTLVDALRGLGADITYAGREGFAPLRVKGKALKGGTVELDASVSSQFITALMLIGPYLEGGLELRLSGKAVSTPYLQMTARLMKRAGAELNFSENHIQVSQGEYVESNFDVEPDWSAASYFYSAVAINPNLEIVMPGLRDKSLQGDAVVEDIYKRFGVETVFKAHGALLRSMEIFDDSNDYHFIDCPDLAQTVAVTAAGLQIPFRLTGLQTLRVKETDRIAALANELSKFGVSCIQGDDFLELSSFTKPNGIPVIATYHDHRMAMAFAPLAMLYDGLAIDDPDVVSKSFPDFWWEMGNALGQ